MNVKMLLRFRENAIALELDYISFLKACQDPEQVQNLDRLGLIQVNSAIKSRLTVQYSSPGGASLPDCVGKNSKTNDGGKAW